MQPSTEQIQELRNNFFKKVSETGAVIDTNDVNRIKNNDDWVKRFLLHHDLDMNEALKMMLETCEWRKKFGTNEISESNVRMEYLVDGSFFSHGKDVDGCTLFIFKCKKHVKGTKDFEELKRCVVYWFERLEREVKGAPISIFFDLEGCGLSNLDMDFTKYLIGLFKQYYPYFLNYIIIYEMAWILNAAFKIIKTLLPEKAVAKMKFVNKTSLKEFITADQALKCWGGENDYVFSFVPETKEETVSPLIGSNSVTGKKVHFADGSPMTDIQGFGDKDDYEPGMLSVNPASCLSFIQDGSELSSNVTLTNNDNKSPVTYKVKTTSPEKFRVRPSAGVLSPGQTTTITLTLLPGFQLGGLSRDKFLVLSMPVDTTDFSTLELADLWKNISGKNVVQHKLRCAQTGAETSKNGSITGSATSDNEQNQLTQLSSNVSKLLECQSRLHHDVKNINILQCINICLVLGLAAMVVYLFTSQVNENNVYYECPRHI